MEIHPISQWKKLDTTKLNVNHTHISMRVTAKPQSGIYCDTLHSILVDNTWPKRDIPSWIIPGVAFEKLRRIVLCPPPVGWKGSPGTNATFCSIATSNTSAAFNDTGNVPHKNRSPNGARFVPEEVDILPSYCIVTRALLAS